MPTEQDPLLPKDKGAPEIHGSRSPSINNEYISSEGAAEEDGTRHRQSPSDWSTVGFVICFLACMLLLLFSDDFLGQLLGDKRPQPKTIEERVNRILSDTPLIGT
jgi:membrane dipeptidase